jgi:hypothetical protein
MRNFNTYASGFHFRWKWATSTSAREGQVELVESGRIAVTRLLFCQMFVLLCGWLGPQVGAAETARHHAKVYVLLWFDTEDYLLPADDDAAMRLANFLTEQRIRATFKVVGEKARTLERRGRRDVIAALSKHEIGYHANWHSVQPTPALFLAHLGWADGVAEFDRRERPGFDDVARIFGTTPTCYGQPGSSWGPQSFGAIKQWGMQVYLDAGSHVRLDDRPHYYCGVLTLYRLAHTLRVDLDGKDTRTAEARFVQARQSLLDEGGGVVSIYYHPCEFVHKEFWDSVNFRGGANPPREKWKPPTQATPEESQLAYQTFESYIRFIQRFDDVQFITASEAARVYSDRAAEHSFTTADLRRIAGCVTKEVSFQRYDGYALSASEIFSLLNRYVTERGQGHKLEALELKGTPLGPLSAPPPQPAPVTTDLNQFLRTAIDVQDWLDRQQSVPTVVWLGSKGVPPESYLCALADVARRLLADEPPSDLIEVKPATLAAAGHVANDDPKLWSWIIFPPGFRAPAMMELAKRQAWTLKPAILDTSIGVGQDDNQAK